MDHEEGSVGSDEEENLGPGDLQKLTRLAMSTDRRLEDRLDALDMIAGACVREATTWDENQRVCREAGLPETLLDLANGGGGESEAVEDGEREAMAFNTISQLCGWNEANAALFASSPRYLEAVETALMSDLTEQVTWALIATSNILMHAFSCHTRLLPLIPRMSSMLMSSRLILEPLCIALYNFSLNPISRPALVESGAVEWMSKQCWELLQESPSTGVVSAMTVANCVAEIANPSSAPSTEDSRRLMNFVCQCLRASLREREYPPHSQVYFSVWEVLHAMTCLATVAENRPLLIRAGALDLIYFAVKRGGGHLDSDRVRTRVHGLNLLWALSVD